jgi:hypothetical protein
MKHSSEKKTKKRSNRKKLSNTRINTRKIKKKSQTLQKVVFGLLLFGIIGWGLLFLNGKVTLGGVPAHIILKFLTDPYSVEQYFLGNKVQLHNRLQSLGIEEEIKDYYRPKIANEIVLDRHIHQILYERTGYIGDNYSLGSDGLLILKPSRQIR